MKKKFRLTRGWQNNVNLRKIWMTMKLTAFLLLFTVAQLIASETYSQATKLTLQLKDASLKEVLNKIEERSEYFFLYNSKLVDVNRKVSVDVKEEKISNLLSQLFPEKDIAFFVVDRQIILSPKKDAIELTKLQQKITGTVTDATNGEAITGANVIIEGTTAGTVTDINGRFSLEVPKTDAVLLVSFLGYNTERIQFTGQSAIEVKLVPDITKLEEVVVVGYGTQKKRDIIGSVASINEKDIQATKSLNFLDALQGKASGITIQNTSGTPGAPVKVQIRGVHSINSSSSPLWIVDGVQIISDNIGKSSENVVAQSPFASINPNDIESVEVLKDAAATAIYGSRGSNGVIIITTKSGKKGSGKLAIDYSTGISELSRSIDSRGLANTQEWFAISDMARANSGQSPFDPTIALGAAYRTPITREDAINTQSDWASIALRAGSFHDINASIRQGSDKSDIFASLNYRKDNGINVGNDLSRITGRVNVNVKPFSNFDLGARLNLSYVENYRTKDKSGNPGGQAGNTGSFTAIVEGALPWYPIYDANDPSGFWNPSAGNQALATRRDLLLDKKEQYRALANIFGEYSIPFMKGLAIRAEASLDLIQDNGVNFRSPLVTFPNQSSVYEGSVTARSYNYNSYLKYDREFNNKHSIQITAGTEAQVRSRYNYELSGLDVVGYNQSIGDANPGTIQQANAYESNERYIQSFFGRINYKFNDRYLIGGSFRRDGSSAFDPEVRWGNFAALSGGWILSEEQFFSRFRKTVNLLKLRGSFGQTGNESIPNNQNITILNNNSGDRYGPVANAGTSYNVGNKSITWEKTNSYDLGLDFGLMENRISGSVAYYLQQVQDLLLKVPTPPSAGINDVYDNVGDLDNYGWEFNIYSSIISKTDFKWNVDFNVTTNTNKIQKLTPELEASKGNVLFVGGRLDLFKVAEYAGIDPERGVHMIKEFDYAVFQETGNIVYTGRNIPFTETNSKLYQVVQTDKSRLPTYFGGISNSFSYKNFDLNIFVNFSGGNWIYDLYERKITNVANEYWNLKADLLTESWMPGKSDAKYPLLFTESGGAPATTAWDPAAVDPNTGLNGWWRNPDVETLAFPNARETYDKNGGAPLSKYLKKGDYLRVKTITLGYNLPKQLLSKIRIQNMKVYMSAHNILTLTGYTGWDPESDSSGDFTPLTKNYTVGVNIAF